MSQPSYHLHACLTHHLTESCRWRRISCDDENENENDDDVDDYDVDVVVDDYVLRDQTVLGAGHLRHRQDASCLDLLRSCDDAA